MLSRDAGESLPCPQESALLPESGAKPSHQSAQSSHLQNMLALSHLMAEAAAWCVEVLKEPSTLEHGRSAVKQKQESIRCSVFDTD